MWLTGREHVGLRCESIWGNRDDDTACATSSSKSIVCAHDWLVMMYGIASVFDCIYVERALHFPFFFPPSVKRPVHLKPLLDVWGNRKCCNHQNFGHREQRTNVTFTSQKVTNQVGQTFTGCGQAVRKSARKWWRVLLGSTPSRRRHKFPCRRDALFLADLFSPPICTVLSPTKFGEKSPQNLPNKRPTHCYNIAH